uniref:Uncharacterized protein n=2 Tax=Oryza sativa subsp. japonica TaxID=39947 RepID=Q10HZ3_ORYSJ|nr:hypothetical protein [Oryza sativa Japonica Group]ABF97197.1 hypothetical protein LOC_Os03g37340 [Oryza sativa Japonica Group]
MEECGADESRARIRVRGGGVFWYSFAQWVAQAQKFPRRTMSALASREGDSTKACMWESKNRRARAWRGQECATLYNREETSWICFGNRKGYDGNEVRRNRGGIEMYPNQNQDLIAYLLANGVGVHNLLIMLWQICKARNDINFKNKKWEPQQVCTTIYVDALWKEGQELESSFTT